ncbi:MAG: rhodanese-like domain-containing protein [Gammaproteobacteria bacterium]|nr:rhodanese-like domain-containing protein [Gammaproteobacteria bacterium]NIR97335.1 rhodanese-like domain-containing protein [Gammaproteobacteria bacterium]NIT63378.1 rhodanese-like domain-containing protein [Gammaproteobacteria bacterium]NIV20305.1 rhodanese-like domain-containing protein [Gammaproteobacteria bacterium]NIX10722.1 rhodanese-like domain-containing protein [Gammaproteobacteria bacterium]
MSEHKIKSLSPEQAWELTQKDPRSILIDVRSNMEFLFIGHPKGAINIPWIDEPDWVINPHFVAEVRKVILGGISCDEEAGCAPVILICRSGKRSLHAGEKLIEEGFTNVYNVLEGFEGELDENHHRSSLGGWRYHGLPWEQC